MTSSLGPLHTHRREVVKRMIHYQALPYSYILYVHVTIYGPLRQIHTQKIVDAVMVIIHALITSNLTFIITSLTLSAMSRALLLVSHASRALRRSSMAPSHPLPFRIDKWYEQQVTKLYKQSHGNSGRHQEAPRQGRSIPVFGEHV